MLETENRTGLVGPMDVELRLLAVERNLLTRRNAEFSQHPPTLHSLHLKHEH